MSHRTSTYIAAVLEVATVAGGGDLRTNRQVAERAMAEFHRQLADRRFERIYENADPALKAVAPKAELIGAMERTSHKYGRWLRSEVRHASCLPDDKVKFFNDAWYESGDVSEIFVWQVIGRRASLVLYRPTLGRQAPPVDHPTLSPPCPK